MLVVMRRHASAEQIHQVKEFLLNRDLDIHQSTGANRLIIGVIGPTEHIDTTEVEALPGVHVVFRIPPEEDPSVR